MLNKATWKFPLPRTHTGMPLGNATTGLLVWGEGDHLKITISRADLWDNRGGMSWTEKQNFKDIRKCLEAYDDPGIKALFKTDTEDVPGQPVRPSVMPVGRLDLILPDGSKLKSGKINLKTGHATVAYNRNGKAFEISLDLAMESQAFKIEADELDNIEMKSVPSWDFLGEYFTSISMTPPVMLDESGMYGWIQELPVNDGICIACRKTSKAILAVTERAVDAKVMKSQAAAALDRLENGGMEKAMAKTAEWWKQYWNDIPEVEIPSPRLELLYSLGLYKFACFTNPSGNPATLQGPWIEEYTMPPWSSDYHFNINVQMCYWPAYKANRLSHLRPMFDMVWSWRDKLRNNAKLFVGIDDGFMMPHAVDDQCTCMGSFWSGSIDHACSAWIAQMMYQYVQYTADMEFLKNVAFPFMKGTMRVFEEMLEHNADGSYTLPISVSPEYRGSNIDSWGRNASFQLAAIHRLCEDLISAASLLNEEPSPIWADINTNLPRYTVVENQIGLWNGLILEESHRHHSHLGSICPFDTIDLFAPENLEIVSNSVRHWVKMGMGLWSGWCVPWASMLYSRMHNGNMAEMLLENLSKVFMNKGYGTLHDCEFPGFTVMGTPDPLHKGPGVQLPKKRNEIMQMDAGMGAIVAVQDMLMHSRRGIVHIFPGKPSGWENARFSNMPCEGGFLVSAEIIDEELQPVKIVSRIGGDLKLGNPWLGKDVKVSVSGKETMISGNILELQLPQNAKCVIAPV